MKTKNKMVSMVEIAIVLCSVFFVAIPAIAAEQSQEMQGVSATASEDEYVLDIYGNANEDDTIDMRDLTYVKLIFFGKKPETELADAKYDGKINPLDFIQIKLIIVGKEKELTFVDSADSILTVKKPVERIIPLNSYQGAEIIKAFGAEDRVVGVGPHVTEAKEFFPELSELPNCGWKEVNQELIVKLKPDIVMALGFVLFPSKEVLEDKLEPAGITVVRFDFMDMRTTKKEAITLGYILDKKDEAQDYVNFLEQHMEQIKQKVEELAEEEKPRVFFTGYTGKVTTNSGQPHLKIVGAGGINIADDLPFSMENIVFDLEWLLKQDPQIIHICVPPTMYGGGYATDDPAEMMELMENLISLPGWEKINAVQNDRVYITSSRLSRVSYPVEMSYLVKFFHPELFKDLDPEAIHQEYLTRFQGLDYDLDERGVFVYPPIILGEGKLAGIPDRYYDIIVAQP